MKLSVSPEYFEYIANHPRVHPHVSMHGMGPLAFGSIWHQCIGLEFERGGFIFHRLGPHYYEVHTLFLPKAKDIQAKAAEAAHYIFTATECEELVTRVPDDLPHALRLAHAMGFKDRFHRDNAWARSTGNVGMHYLGMTVTDWILSSATPEGDGTEPVRDRYAGFAFECARAGMMDKGVYLYNRFALFVGLPLLQTVERKEVVPCP